MSGKADFLPYVCGEKSLDAFVHILNSFSDDNYDINKQVNNESPAAVRATNNSSINSNMSTYALQSPEEVSSQKGNIHIFISAVRTDMLS
jgi:hypothetical protein